MLNDDKLVQDIQESELDQELFEILLEEQRGLQTAFNRKDYEKTLNKTGKFCETLFQLLEEFMHGSYDFEPDREQITDELEDLDSSDYSDGLRILIPRLANSMYDFRNRRGGAHVSRVDPQYMDAQFAVQGSRWILGELLRIFGDGEISPEDLKAQIHQVATRSLPLVEEFEDGDAKVLAETSSAKEDILLLLYHFYPERVSNDRLDNLIPTESRENILMNLRNAAQRDNLVHRNDQGAKLTLRGRREVENTHGVQLKDD